jgi:hypothetical protein
VIRTLILLGKAPSAGLTVDGFKISVRAASFVTRPIDVLSRDN